jgi:hypothetical protein
MNLPLAEIHVTTPLHGLGLAFFTWALALVIALFVGLVMWLLVRTLGGKGKAAPAEKK